MKTRVLIIRDRKDRRAKDGNDQKVPLLNLTGYDAWEILLPQRIITRGWGRVFPYNHRSVSAAFTRACDELKIEDLHFRDLRHEGTSRLFEAGLTIEKVALVTGMSATCAHIHPFAAPACFDFTRPPSAK
jgi:integrase